MDEGVFFECKLTAPDKSDAKLFKHKVDKVAEKLHIKNKHALFLTPDKEKEIDGIKVMSLGRLISSGGKGLPL